MSGALIPSSNAIGVHFYPLLGCDSWSRLACVSKTCAFELTLCPFSLTRVHGAFSVHPFTFYVSWVQNDVNQFGLYLLCLVPLHHSTSLSRLACVDNYSNGWRQHKCVDSTGMLESLPFLVLMS